MFVFFVKQKTAYEMRISDWSSDVCSSDLLSKVLRARREMQVSEIMQPEQTLIPVDMDQEEVALRFQKYALISAAVVDASGRLVGVIKIGRASCRERVCQYGSISVVAVSFKKKIEPIDIRGVTWPMQ